MKKAFYLIACMLWLTQWVVAQEPHKESVVGEWLSEDKDGKIQIYKQGDKFYGKITWGKTSGRKDTENPDPALRSQPLMGLVILKNFTFNGKYWENGTIYDPNTGKTYSCTMKLKGNNALEIRGFVGISLLGRTTVWTRTQ